MNFQTPPDGCTALSRGFPAEGATGMRAVQGINFLLSFESLGYHSGTDGRTDVRNHLCSSTKINSD